MSIIHKPNMVISVGGEKFRVRTVMMDLIEGVPCLRLTLSGVDHPDHQITGSVKVEKIVNDALDEESLMVYDMRQKGD